MSGIPPKPSAHPTLTEAWLYQNGQVLPKTEYLAEERPLDIRLDGESLAITLCSPGADRDLALGLLFSEGRVQAAEEIALWRQGQNPGSGLTGPIAWQEATCKSPASPSATASDAKAAASRILAMNSACGLCGKTEWEQAPAPPLPSPARSQGISWTLEQLPELFSAMRSGQSEFSRTGGCHAAAAFSADGTLLSLREDVGRHNAVDKVVGDLLSRRLIGKNADSGDSQWPALLCVSGRVAYEIVAKAYRAGFAALAAVGAPSTLSVRHAQAWGLTLLGFCREGRATAYAHRETLISPPMTSHYPITGKTDHA